MGIPFEVIDRQLNLESNESKIIFHPYADICEILGEFGLAGQAAIHSNTLQKCRRQNTGDSEQFSKKPLIWK